MLGLDAVAGRTVTPADDVRGGGPDGLVAVISSRFWQSRFGGAADVLGCTGARSRAGSLLLASLPRGFLGPEVGEAMDVFLLRSPPKRRFAAAIRRSNDRNCWWLQMVARLQPNQTIQPGEAALNAARPSDPRRDAATTTKTRSLGEVFQRGDHPVYRRYRCFPAVFRCARGLRERFEQPLTIIMMVVDAAVLLIACANIANLMLARATARRHELSVRLALGASRLRLGCQMFIESLILAAGGGLRALLLPNSVSPSW